MATKRLEYWRFETMDEYYEYLSDRQEQFNARIVTGIVTSTVLGIVLFGTIVAYNVAYCGLVL